MKGSLLLAIFLLLIFFPIGVLYVIYQSINATNFCPKCSQNKMIPLDSPRGEELSKKKNG